MAVAVSALAAPAAVAHRSPAECTTSGLDLTLVRDRAIVRNGDVINYTVSISNNKPGSCDLTGITVTLTLPAADGTPTGEQIAVPLAALPAGSAEQVVTTRAYTVAVNPGVVDAVAQATAVGTLHDAPTTDHPAEILKRVGTGITQPHLTLTETASPSSGQAPLGVTFTYTLTNDSTTDAPIQNPTVSDDRCANPVYTGGDANGNSVLDVGESWTYACTTTLTRAGTVTSTATATGTNAVDGRPVPSNPATASVTVTQPPASEVLGTQLASPRSRAARPNARCITTPKRLKVRARERTRVRVTVRDEGRGVERALVRIVGPGYRKRKLTNRRGVAVFRVVARRSGTLVIQTNQCSGADRVSVLRVRRVSNNQVPRGTG